MYASFKNHLAKCTSTKLSCYNAAKAKHPTAHTSPSYVLSWLPSAGSQMADTTGISWMAGAADQSRLSLQAADATTKRPLWRCLRAGLKARSMRTG
jgi:hypothetical protein